MVNGATPRGCPSMTTAAPGCVVLTDSVATFVIEKSKFPMDARVTDDAGSLLFEQQLDYAALSEANFRVAITDAGIVAPSLPGPASPTPG